MDTHLHVLNFSRFIQALYWTTRYGNELYWKCKIIKKAKNSSLMTETGWAKQAQCCIRRCFSNTNCASRGPCLANTRRICVSRSTNGVHNLTGHGRWPTWGLACADAAISPSTARPTSDVSPIPYAVWTSTSHSAWNTQATIALCHTGGVIASHYISDFISPTLNSNSNG